MEADLKAKACGVTLMYPESTFILPYSADCGKNPNANSNKIEKREVETPGYKNREQIAKDGCATGNDRQSRPAFAIHRQADNLSTGVANYPTEDPVQINKGDNRFHKSPDDPGNGGSYDSSTYRPQVIDK